MNDPVHLKLIEFLSRSLDLLLEGLEKTKLRKLSRSQSFQVALIARVHERGDAVLTLLREDRDHSTGELVRSILEAHATLVFLKKARKARFRLEIESAEEAIKMLTRMAANPQVSIDDKVKAKRILKEKIKRKEMLFSKGIRKATKAERIAFLPPVAKDAYWMLSAESHHDLLSLFDSHFDTSKGILEYCGGNRHSDRALIIYVSLIVEAIHAAMKCCWGSLSSVSNKEMWKSRLVQHGDLIAEIGRWGKPIVEP